MSKIRKGDTVIVITGKDKGREGVVLAIDSPKTGNRAQRVVVEGVNVVKRHTKPNPSQEKPGGIIEKEKSVAISNIALLNRATGKADKIGFKILENGRKVRVFRSTGEVVDL